MSGPAQHPVVVGYDGSDGARDALALAGVLASASARPVVLVDVYPPDLPDWSEEADRREQRYARMHEVLASAPAAPALERHAVRGRSVAEGLKLYAEDADASAIVVGSPARAGLGHTTPGTVAQQLLHGSPCAVALAPRGFAERGHSELKRILVGYVDSEEARSALRAAERLAHASGALVRVVAVAPQAHGRRDAEREALAANLDEAVGALVRTVAGEGVLVEGDPADALLAETDGTDLIVTGSRGYGPTRQVLLGSVTARLLSRADAPVLVMPRGAESELVSAVEPAASPRA